MLAAASFRLAWEQHQWSVEKTSKNNWIVPIPESLDVLCRAVVRVV
jgi:hypothetical protein